MKQIWVAFLLVSAIAANARAQSIGDIARAERRRQQELIPAKVIQDIATPKPAAEKAASAPEVKPEPKPAPAPATPRESELAKLQQEKSALLTRLSFVIHDRKAVQEIDQRLAEIQKRTDELKDTVSKTDSKQQ